MIFDEKYLFKNTNLLLSKFVITFDRLFKKLEINSILIYSENIEYFHKPFYFLIKISS